METGRRGFELPTDRISLSSTGTSYYYKPLYSGPTSQSWRAQATKITETYSSYAGWKTSHTTASPRKVYAVCVR